MILRLAVAGCLALAALLPPDARMLADLSAIILLGVPHGALDGELGRTRLRPRFGAVWFAVFALPYLSVAALVLLCWRWAPMPMLAGFLAASVLHFGQEETGSRDPVTILASGGAPIALSVLSHPAATAWIFGTIAGVPLSHPPLWLHVASLLWAFPFAIRMLRLARAGDRQGLAMALPVVAASVLLPPLTAFAIYFICVHAPAHVRGLIADRVLAPRIVDAASAARLSVGITALTLLIGAMLWPLYSGPTVPRLLCLTIQGLAALTLPHMLLELWLSRNAARPR